MSDTQTPISPEQLAEAAALQRAMNDLQHMIMLYQRESGFVFQVILAIASGEGDDGRAVAFTSSLPPPVLIDALRELAAKVEMAQRPAALN